MPNENAPQSRPDISRKILSAYAASVLMAFLSSCIFIFVSFGDGDYARLFAGLLAVDKTAWSVLFVHVLAYNAFGAMLRLLFVPDRQSRI